MLRPRRRAGRLLPAQGGVGVDGAEIGDDAATDVSAVTFPGSGTWLSRSSRMASTAGDDAMSKTTVQTRNAMRVILPNVMANLLFWCARILSVSRRLERSKYLGHHWMRTMAQARTGDKNLVGGLLVPW